MTTLSNHSLMNNAANRRVASAYGYYNPIVT